MPVFTPHQDQALKAIPEVATVWGKAGRAETATDPAGLDSRLYYQLAGRRARTP